MNTITLKNGNTVYYRHLLHGDEEKLKKFHLALSEQSKHSFTPHAYDDKALSTIIARSESNEDCAFIVLDSNNNAIAYFFLWWYSSGFPVLGIGIADDYQKQGLGKQLMNILIESGKKGGCKTIELTTRLDNEKAFALYEKVGFKCLGQVANKAGDGTIVQEWHMYYPIEPGVIPPERKHEAPA